MVKKILKNEKMIKNNEYKKDIEKFNIDGRKKREKKRKKCD
jgi:hypothetical protein